MKYSLTEFLKKIYEKIFKTICIIQGMVKEKKTHTDKGRMSSISTALYNTTHHTGSRSWYWGYFTSRTRSCSGLGCGWVTEDMLCGLVSQVPRPALCRKRNPLYKLRGFRSTIPTNELHICTITFLMPTYTAKLKAYILIEMTKIHLHYF